MPQEKSKRRRYQFSLRTTFVVVTLACISFGWWVQRSREWIRQRNEMISSGIVYAPIEPTLMVINGRRHAFDKDKMPISAPGWLWVFGEVGYPELWCDKEDAAVRAKLLFPESAVIYPSTWQHPDAF